MERYQKVVEILYVFRSKKQIIVVTRVSKNGCFVLVVRQHEKLYL